MVALSLPEELFAHAVLGDVTCHGNRSNDRSMRIPHRSGAHLTVTEFARARVAGDLLLVSNDFASQGAQRRSFLDRARRAIRAQYSQLRRDFLNPDPRY